MSVEMLSLNSTIPRAEGLYSDASADDIEYTDDENDVSCSSTSTLTDAAALPPQRNNHNMAMTFDTSEEEDVDDADSDSSDSESDVDDDFDMKDPFEFSEDNPFFVKRQKVNDYSQIIVPQSVLPEISVTEAKQRILVCCRDLGISETNEIRYPDLQKIYFKHFGTALDKAELNLLFSFSSALEVLQKDFASYLRVKLAAESDDKVMRLTAIGDIRKSLDLVENNEIFGLLKPIPELSPIEVEEVLKSRSRCDRNAVKTNLNQRISRREFVDLRKKGFAKENFAELPSVRNPVIKEREEEGSDEFTDEENELRATIFVSLKPRRKFVVPKDPNFGRRIPQRLHEPSNAPQSKTSSLANTDVTSMEELRKEKRRQFRNVLLSDDDSDVWSDGTEDPAPALFIKPVGEVYRDKLNVTVQSKSFVHNKEELYSDEEFLAAQQLPKQNVELFEEKNTNTSETLIKKQSEEHVASQPGSSAEEVDSISNAYEDTVNTPSRSVIAESSISSINDTEEYGTYSEYGSVNVNDIPEYDESDYSSDESLHFVGKD